MPKNLKMAIDVADRGGLGPKAYVRGVQGFFSKGSAPPPSGPWQAKGHAHRQATVLWKTGRNRIDPSNRIASWRVTFPSGGTPLVDPNGQAVHQLTGSGPGSSAGALVAPGAQGEYSYDVEVTLDDGTALGSDPRIVVWREPEEQLTDLVARLESLTETAGQLHAEAEDALGVARSLLPGSTTEPPDSMP